MPPRGVRIGEAFALPSALGDVSLAIGERREVGGVDGYVYADPGHLRLQRGGYAVETVSQKRLVLAAGGGSGRGREALPGRSHVPPCSAAGDRGCADRRGQVADPHPSREHAGARARREDARERERAADLAAHPGDPRAHSIVGAVMANRILLDACEHKLRPVEGSEVEFSTEAVLESSDLGVLCLVLHLLHERRPLVVES